MYLTMTKAILILLILALSYSTKTRSCHQYYGTPTVLTLYIAWSMLETFSFNMYLVSFSFSFMFFVFWSSQQLLNLLGSSDSQILFEVTR